MGSPPLRKVQEGFSSYGKALRSAGPLFASGLQLAASVAVMFFLGRWLDGLWGTSPWLMIAGTIFGLGAGMYNFIRMIMKFDSSGSEKDDR